MGEKNHAMCSYLAIPEIFADFINGALFDGRSQIEEEDVMSYDGVYHEKVKDGNGEKIKLERTRDVVKGIAKGNKYAVVGVENQNKVHYAMPFRCMEYEVAEYIKQLRFIHKNYQKKERTTEEFLSKMSRDERLNPVVVIMFYHGTGEYEGCTDLYGMLELDGENAVYKEFITNYRMNLITLQDIKEEKFKTGLKQLIGVMKCSKDKNALQEYMEENFEEFSHMDEETFDTISVMVNQKDLIKYKKKCQNEEGMVNMCRAIEDIREEGIQAFIDLCKEFSVSKEEAISKLMQKLSIAHKKAAEYVNKYWE
ncbi:MAG: Rpn family recombination-promoting nuclease/putative transposase [Lachnospiraceae bacterium]|nr:Rpn family recombination-promoting nuclease/putative transposase [Lachnospiraceae bacterium]